MKFFSPSTCYSSYPHTNQEIKKKEQRHVPHLETLFPTKKEF